MKKSIKLVTAAATAMMLGGAIAPTIVNASIKNNIQTTDESTVVVSKLSDEKKNYLSNDFGLTESELNNEDIDYLYNIANPRTRVGASAVAKAVLKVWKKLPAGVKSKITKYAGISGFLKAIDHFTGTEYHIIYSACRYVGMPKNVADGATKVITLVI